MKTTSAGLKDFDRTQDYEDAERLLLNCSFSIELNANDFFGWATAYSVHLSIFDMWWALPIVKKYGRVGISAVMCYIEQQLPIRPHRSFELIKACREIKELDPQVQSRSYIDE